MVKRPTEIQQQSSKIIVTKFNDSISRLHVLVTPRDSRPNTGPCAESDNVNVASDFNPTTNVQENNNYSDYQADDNLSCLEN